MENGIVSSVLSFGCPTSLPTMARKLMADCSRRIREHIPAAEAGIRGELDVWAKAQTYLRNGCVDVENLQNGHAYVEKDEPQPQDLVEWGLMKLKPWRMRVSS
jgi:hypothetical protein